MIRCLVQPNFFLKVMILKINDHILKISEDQYIDPFRIKIFRQHSLLNGTTEHAAPFKPSNTRIIKYELLISDY